MASVFIAALLFLTLCDNVNALKCYHWSYDPMVTNQTFLVNNRGGMRMIEDGCNYCEYERDHDSLDMLNQRCITEFFQCVTEKEWKPENALHRCQPASFYTPESTITKGLAKDSILCNTDLCNLACDEYAAMETTTTTSSTIPVTTKNFTTATSKGPIVSILDSVMLWILVALFERIC